MIQSEPQENNNDNPYHLAVSILFIYLDVFSLRSNCSVVQESSENNMSSVLLVQFYFLTKERQCDSYACCMP